MTLRKLFAIYLCASLRASLVIAYARLMWAGLKCDARSLWSIQPKGKT